MLTVCVCVCVCVCMKCTENGAKVNRRGGPTGKSPLMLAATYGHTDTLKLLIRKGANLNQKSNERRTEPGSRAGVVTLVRNQGWSRNTALILATMAGNVECVEILVAAGANKEEEGYSCDYHQ